MYRMDMTQNSNTAMNSNKQTFISLQTIHGLRKKNSKSALKSATQTAFIREISY